METVNELVKVKAFLTLQSNLNSKIELHVKKINIIIYDY